MIDQNDALTLAGNKDLHGTEYRVVLFLIGKMSYENEVFTTQAFMAKELNLPRPLVTKTLDKLSDMGLLKKISVNGQNGYKVSKDVASRGTLKEEPQP